MTPAFAVRQEELQASKLRLLTSLASWVHAQPLRGQKLGP
jgi:hypothetical protein